MSSLVSKVIVDGSECNEVKCGTTNYETIVKYFNSTKPIEGTVDLGGGVTADATTITFENDTTSRYEYTFQQSCALYYGHEKIYLNFNWDESVDKVLELVVNSTSSCFLKINNNDVIVFFNVVNIYYKEESCISGGYIHIHPSLSEEEKNYLRSREEELENYIKFNDFIYESTLSFSRQAKVPKHLFKRLAYLTSEDGYSLENAIVDNDIKLKYYFTYKPEDYNGLDSVLISLTKFLYNKDSGEAAYYGEVTDNSIFRVLGGFRYYAKKPTDFTVDKNDLLNNKHKFFNNIFYYGTTTNNQTGMFYVNKVYAVYDNGCYVSDEWANEEWYPDLEAVDIEADENSSKYSSCKFYQFFHGISTSPFIYRTVSRLYVN